MNGFGNFCPPGSRPYRPGNELPKPPVGGYSYSEITLAQAITSNPNQTFPLATVPSQGSFTFDLPTTIAAVWLATSIKNPNGVVAGVAVGKTDGLIQSLNRGSQLYLVHLTQASVPISRTNGFAFGENAGLLLNPGESFGVYVSGNDASLEIAFVCCIVYLTRNQ